MSHLIFLYCILKDKFYVFDHELNNTEKESTVVMQKLCFNFCDFYLNERNLTHPNYPSDM